MKLKVISDGTAQGTKVVNEATGEELENVFAVQWTVDAQSGKSHASIGVVQVAMESLGEAE
jgi:hypothetical protein